MAPDMDFFTRDLAAYLAARLGEPVEALLDIPWQERERRLDSGQLALCWICGLPYARRASLRPAGVTLVAAPVFLGMRYQDKPVYFSDVVVRHGSPYQGLAGLRGAAWAFNEPGSHSGYNLVRSVLAARGERDGFFSRAVESGSHQESLQMILRGEVDASAIDCTVLELEMRRDPALGQRLRVIETLGPSPIPPWVAPASSPAGLRAKLRELMLGMAGDPQGREILAKAYLARFAPVADQDYDPIREMDRLAQGVRLSHG